MVSKINTLRYNCPFCGKKLESRFSKCFKSESMYQKSYKRAEFYILQFNL